MTTASKNVNIIIASRRHRRAVFSSRKITISVLRTMIFLPFSHLITLNSETPNSKKNVLFFLFVEQLFSYLVGLSTRLFDLAIPCPADGIMKLFSCESIFHWKINLSLHRNNMKSITQDTGGKMFGCRCGFVSSGISGEHPHLVS